MTNKVYVKIRGLAFSKSEQDLNQIEDENNIVEVINVGKYQIVNGSEYIKYDEIFEDNGEKAVNIIKIGQDGAVDVSKKGAITTHMTFIPGEKSLTAYETPYGNMYLGIICRTVNIDRTDSVIRIKIDYSLEINYEETSDCNIDIEISSEDSFSF